MKKTLKFSLYALMVCSLVISTAEANEFNGKEEMYQEEATEIKELTIRNSGFRSRSTVVIRYQEKDKKIILQLNEDR